MIASNKRDLPTEATTLIPAAFCSNGRSVSDSEYVQLFDKLGNVIIALMFDS